MIEGSPLPPFDQLAAVSRSRLSSLTRGVGRESSSAQASHQAVHCSLTSNGYCTYCEHPEHFATGCWEVSSLATIQPCCLTWFPMRLVLSTPMWPWKGGEWRSEPRSLSRKACAVQTTPLNSTRCLVKPELRVATHLGCTSIARAPGGITLGREQSELDADFTAPGASCYT